MRKLLRLNVLSLMLALVLCLGLAGCNGQEGDQKEGKTLKLGTMSTIEPFMTTLKDALVAKGYKAEVVMFDANNMGAIATNAGDLDGYIHNHLPWIQTFNKKTNGKVTMVKPYLAYYRMALYSSKYKTLDELPNGCQIAVPDDPANFENSLLMLQSIGLLTLNPKAGDFVTKLDIKDNPKNIQFVETEISTTARSIHDVDAVFCPATRIRVAGIDPNVFLAEDPNMVNFPVGLTVHADSVDKPWVKDAMAILASDEMRAKFNEIFGGTLVLYPK